MNIIPQAGVIAWRETAEYGDELVLVTSSSGRHWTVPKGNINGHPSPVVAAQCEAFEEAGLVGSLGEPVGSYTYLKQGAMREVLLFSMEVVAELPEWPESRRRERRWMSVEQAIEAVGHLSLARLIRQLATRRLATG